MRGAQSTNNHTINRLARMARTASQIRKILKIKDI